MVMAASWLMVFLIICTEMVGRWFTTIRLFSVQTSSTSRVFWNSKGGGHELSKHRGKLARWRIWWGVCRQALPNCHSQPNSIVGYNLSISAWLRVYLAGGKIVVYPVCVCPIAESRLTGSLRT